MSNIRSEHEILILNTHLAAELYANLTRFPKEKVHPLAAAKTIRHLNDTLKAVYLTMEDYLAAIDRCARLGLSEAVIYDALHFQAAVKAQVDVLYTANLRDFLRLVESDTTFKIQSE